MTKVGLISLGCAKNLIDSEIMAGHLAQAGMALVPNAAEADVLIVNTCSFIRDAKTESIASIQDATEARDSNRRLRRQRIIVAGCLAQRFNKELPGLMPKVDAFIGIDQVAEIVPIIQRLLAGERTADTRPVSVVTPVPRYIPDFDTPRMLLTSGHSAYVKIAEGCNHGCAFCIIPGIRGRHRSRTQASVVAEVKSLLAMGVREINLISQDTTFFGMDRWQGGAGRTSKVDSSRGESLSTLLRELDALEGDFWIRLLYTHPAHWSDELIETIAGSRKVVPYVDMPLQHISDTVLARMSRSTPPGYIRDLVRRMRAGIPGLTLRTTFIVGFPGETREEFDELMDFLRETRFERVGIFQYSREEGTKAHDMPGQVHHRTRESRWNKAMALLRDQAEESSASKVGAHMRVLVVAPGVARSTGDAPDIDTIVHVDPALPVGKFAAVEIVGHDGYDLVAKGAARTKRVKGQGSRVKG